MTNFFGYEVRKQHYTLQQIMMGLPNNGFELPAAEEAQLPEERMEIHGMTDELRRPMMLPVKAKRKHKKVPAACIFTDSGYLFIFLMAADQPRGVSSSSSGVLGVGE